MYTSAYTTEKDIRSYFLWLLGIVLLTAEPPRQPRTVKQ